MLERVCARASPLPAARMADIDPPDGVHGEVRAKSISGILCVMKHPVSQAAE